MSDFLAEKRREIDARLDELRPAVNEHERLSAAIVALDGVPAAREQHRVNGGARTRKHASAGRPRARGAGRRKGSGKRAAQAVEIIAGAGTKGITLAGVAQRMGIQPNYLYRVLPPLEAEGRIVKGDKGLYRSA